MEVPVNPVTSMLALSPEHLAAAIRSAHLEPCQLSRVPAPSWLARVICPRVCLDFAEIGPAMWFSGAMPKDCYTLVFVTKCPQKGHSFNFSVQHEDGYLAFFPPGAPVDAHTPAGYSNATLTVPADVFHKALARSFPEMPDKIVNRGAGLRIGRAEQGPLRTLVASLMEGVRNPDGPFSGFARRDGLEGILLDAFLGTLRDGIDGLIPPPKIRMARKLKHLSQAREYVRESLHGPIHLADLCAALGMSERGVEALFRDSLGISPSAFIRHHRLHGVRRALLQASPESGLVKEAALDWGFWHMGHFSENYRTLFGECPTTTLRRA